MKQNCYEAYMIHLTAANSCASWPSRRNSYSRGEGAYPPRIFTQVRQQGELNWESQLEPSGQHTPSHVMSRPESILIRQD